MGKSARLMIIVPFAYSTDSTVGTNGLCMTFAGKMTNPDMTGNHRK
jgi:hypothetical protein